MPIDRSKIRTTVRHFAERRGFDTQEVLSVVRKKLDPNAGPNTLIQIDKLEQVFSETHAPSSTGQPMTPEAQWASDPALQAEFHGNYDAYSAYRRAEAQGRVPGSQKPTPSRRSHQYVDEDGLRAQWDSDPELREEFNGKFESYRAYQIAMQNGQVKVVSR